MTTDPNSAIRSANLLGSTKPTLLPDRGAALRIDKALSNGDKLVDVVSEDPADSLIWAMLSEQAFEAGEDVTAYAYARTGYHRGLDSLRGSGWRGQGPVPASHGPNQGFLRSVLCLADAAGAIDETEEQGRCLQFLVDLGASEAEVRELQG